MLIDYLCKNFKAQVLIFVSPESSNFMQHLQNLSLLKL